MRIRFHAIAFWFALLSPPISAMTFVPVESERLIEESIATLLKSKLKIDAHLKSMDASGDNMRVVTVFKDPKSQSTPKIAVFIDTKVFNKDRNSGKTKAQVISLFSTADIELKGSRIALLEWVNAWNNNILPIRMQISKGKLVAASNLVTTHMNPVAENQVLAAYINLIKIWPRILQSLDNQGLLTLSSQRGPLN